MNEDEELLKECLHYLTIYYLLHPDKSESFEKFINKLEKRISNER